MKKLLFQTLPEKRNFMHSLQLDDCSLSTSIFPPAEKEWSINDLNKSKQVINKGGLNWNLVSDLPVHESIKKGTSCRDEFISRYCRSLKTIAEAGPGVVMFNFNPVVSEIFTHINHITENGTISSFFDMVAFCVFDLYILKRPDARNDYSSMVLHRASYYYKYLNMEQVLLLQNNVLGAYNSNKKFISEMLEDIAAYKNLSAAGLRSNLKYFLGRILPVVSETEVILLLNYDDSCFSPFNLPKAIRGPKDIEDLTSEMDMEFV